MSTNHEKTTYPAQSDANRTFLGRIVAWVRNNVEVVPYDSGRPVGAPLGSPYANGNSSPGAIMASRSGLDH